MSKSPKTLPVTNALKRKYSEVDLAPKCESKRPLSLAECKKKAHAKIDALLEIRKAEGDPIHITAMEIQFKTAELTSSTQQEIDENLLLEQLITQQPVESQRKFIRDTSTKLKMDTKVLNDLKEALEHGSVNISPSDLYCKYVNVDILDHAKTMLTKVKEANQEEIEIFMDQWKEKLKRKGQIFDLLEIVETAMEDKKRIEAKRAKKTHKSEKITEAEVVTEEEEGFNPEKFYKKDEEQDKLKEVKILQKVEVNIMVPPPGFQEFDNMNFRNGDGRPLVPHNASYYPTFHDSNRKFNDRSSKYASNSCALSFCNHCKKEGQWNKCGGCLTAHFCSNNCRNLGWKLHQNSCSGERRKKRL